MTAFAPPPAAPPVPPPAIPLAPASAPPVDASQLPAPPLDPAAPPNLALPPPPPVDPLTAEAMVAVVGIAPFIDKTLRKVHLYHLDRVAKLGDEIDRKLYAFINSDAAAEGAPLVPFDFMTIRDDLMTPPQHEHTTAVIAAFGDLADTGFAAAQIAERVQAYLVGKLPKRERDSIAGVTQEMPPHSDVARFRRLWAVACDPVTTIFQALAEYALSRDMVASFSDLYPLVWKRVDDGITSQLGRKRGVAPKWTPSVRKEQLLRVLAKRESPSSKALGVAMQAQFKKMAAEAAPKAPQHKTKGSASIESTETDRIGSS